MKNRLRVLRAKRDWTQADPADRLYVSRQTIKILTERDSKFSGRFDLDQLETTLDSYAAEGWKIAGGISATSIWKSSKTEILMFLQRERSTTPRIETCA